MAKQEKLNNPENNSEETPEQAQMSAELQKMAEKENLTPEQQYELQKEKALKAPLPNKEYLKAAMIQVDIEDAERAGNEAEVKKLRRELLKIYEDNYDKVLGPDPRVVARQEKIDANLIRDEFRKYDLNNLETKEDPVGFGHDYRDYLLSEDFKKESDKLSAIGKWIEAWWTPERRAESQRKSEEKLEIARRKNLEERERKKIEDNARQEKNKRWFGLGRFF